MKLTLIKKDLHVAFIKKGAERRKVQLNRFPDLNLWVDFYGTCYLIRGDKVTLYQGDLPKKTTRKTPRRKT